MPIIENSLSMAKAEYVAEPYMKTDNAANLYTCSGSKKWSRTFRVAITLTENVNPDFLKLAAIDTAKRMPSFCLKLRNGFFWNYLERTDAEPNVVCESDYPFRSIRLFDTDDAAYRVLYFERRISLEVFHGITDGNGCLTFLKTMVARYLELVHGEIGFDDQTLNVSDVPTADEARDDYLHFADKNAETKVMQSYKTYTYPDKTDFSYSKVVHGLIPLNELKSLAHEKGLTVTEFITAGLIFTAYNFTDCNPSAPIRVSIPMDLRTRFGTKNHRNFVYMDAISFDNMGKRDCTFDDVCAAVKGVIKPKATREALLSGFSSNVASSESKVLRIVPFPIKKTFMLKKYKDTLHSYTMYFSNLTLVTFPMEIDKYIDRVDFVLGTTPYCPFSCSCATYNGIINLAFSNTSKDTTRERFFFNILTSQGLKVRIESSDGYKKSQGGINR